MQLKAANLTFVIILIWLNITTSPDVLVVVVVISNQIVEGIDWKIISKPPQPSFCFAHGDLPVECMDDFHWCYEGDCGPGFWETRFEVQSRFKEITTGFKPKGYETSSWMVFYLYLAGLRWWEPISNRRGVAREQYAKCSSWSAHFWRLWQGKEIYITPTTLSEVDKL